MHVNIVEKGKKFLIQMNIQQQERMQKFEPVLAWKSALRRVMNLFFNYK